MVRRCFLWFFWTMGLLVAFDRGLSTGHLGEYRGYLFPAYLLMLLLISLCLVRPASKEFFKKNNRAVFIKNNDAIQMTKVVDEHGIKTIAVLAHEIWNEYYPSIIGQAQIDYMLSNFQTPAAIKQQIGQEGFLYYLIQDGKGANVGYCAVVPQKEAEELFLSKIYIKAGERGKGYGKQAVDFLAQLARQMKLAKISLMVCKNNIDAIKAYEKMGFVNTGPVYKDIGGGFAMDDYILKKAV